MHSIKPTFIGHANPMKKHLHKYVDPPHFIEVYRRGMGEVGVMWSLGCPQAAKGMVARALRGAPFALLPAGRASACLAFPMGMYTHTVPYSVYQNGPCGGK